MDRPAPQPRHGRDAVQMTDAERQAFYDHSPPLISARRVCMLCGFSEKWFSDNKARLLAECGFPAPRRVPGWDKWAKAEVWSWLYPAAPGGEAAGSGAAADARRAAERLEANLAKAL